MLYICYLCVIYMPNKINSILISLNLANLRISGRARVAKEYTKPLRLTKL